MLALGPTVYVWDSELASCYFILRTFAGVAYQSTITQHVFSHATDVFRALHVRAVTFKSVRMLDPYVLWVNPPPPHIVWTWLPPVFILSTVIYLIWCLMKMKLCNLLEHHSVQCLCLFLLPSSFMQNVRLILHYGDDMHLPVSWQFLFFRI